MTSVTTNRPLYNDTYVHSPANTGYGANTALTHLMHSAESGQKPSKVGQRRRYSDTWSVLEAIYMYNRVRCPSKCSDNIKRTFEHTSNPF